VQKVNFQLRLEIENKFGKNGNVRQLNRVLDDASMAIVASEEVDSG